MLRENMDKMDRIKELVYEKPKCSNCGFQNTLQNVMRHINSKKNVCSKYKNGKPISLNKTI